MARELVWGHASSSGDHETAFALPFLFLPFPFLSFPHSRMQRRWRGRVGGCDCDSVSAVTWHLWLSGDVG